MKLNGLHHSVFEFFHRIAYRIWEVVDSACKWHEMLRHFTLCKCLNVRRMFHDRPYFSFPIVVHIFVALFKLYMVHGTSYIIHRTYIGFNLNGMLAIEREYCQFCTLIDIVVVVYCVLCCTYDGSLSFHIIRFSIPPKHPSF